MTFVRGVSMVAMLAWFGCGGAAAPRATTAEISNTDPAAAVAVRIGWVPAEVGDVATEHEHNLLDARVEPTPGQVVGVVHSEETERREEVLAVADGVPTTIKVHYAVHHIVDSVQGAAQELPAPMRGKTYVVSRVAGAVVVTHEDGRTPSAEEVKEVTDEYDDAVGRRGAMDLFLASMPWTLDVAVPLDAAQLAAVAESLSSDGGKLESMTVTLRGADAATATFAIALAAAGAGDDVDLTLSMSGTAVVERATGRVRSLEFGGPVSGTTGPTHMKLSGTFTSKSTRTY